jgi:hypothetical protein
MSELIPRISDTLDALRGDTRGGPRELARAVRAEQGRALVRAARVDGAAYVARTALMNTAMLTQDEASYIQLAPLDESRYKAIVDAYAMRAANEVAQP